LDKNASDVFLVRGSLQLIESELEEMNKTRVLTFISGAAATSFTFKCDQDYFYRGAYWTTGSANSVNTSGQAALALATKAAYVNGDMLFASSTTTASPSPPIKTFLAKNDILTINIGAASSVVSVVLEYAA
jgi:hypothetical protein